MSVVVAVKGRFELQDYVALACDRQLTTSNGTRVESDAPKWRQVTIEDAGKAAALVAMVGTGSALDALDKVLIGGSSILAYNRQLLDWCIAVLVPELRAAHERARCFEVRDGQQLFGGDVLVAWRDQFVAVGSDGHVFVPSTDHFAIGSGREAALGALSALSLAVRTEDMTAEDRAWHAVRAATQVDCYCGGEPIMGGTRG